MIASMNKILDGLYLGNIESANDFTALKQQGVTHILTVAIGLSPLKAMVSKIVSKINVVCIMLVGLQVEEDRCAGRAE
jgi:hypothetical protein